MRKIVMIMLYLTIATGVSACSSDDPPPEVPEQPGDNDDPGADPNDPDPWNRNMIIKTGSGVFTATLADNSTAKAFKALLPRTFDMSELNGNEKYCSLPQSLPTAASRTGTVRNGDIMLYGSSTLVLFYKTFSTSYSYTRIGALDDPSGLEAALGGGSVRVTFEVAPEK